uniref:hypothetical protein n=1 Tax=Vibrio cholerae TaxID=666 RepID=UPI000AE2DD0C
EFADEVLDADYIAMGHYVRRPFPQNGEKPQMLRGLAQHLRFFAILREGATHIVPHSNVVRIQHFISKF